MALIKRLIERRKIRRTAEQSLAQNPIFITGQPSAPLLYRSASPEVNVARPAAENTDPTPAPAAAGAPEVPTAEGPPAPPPVPVEPAPPLSASSVEVGGGEAEQAVARAPSPPIQPPSSPDAHHEWQLPQWQYTSKRARTNQHQQQRKKRS